jgi:hypothetical protein
MLDEARETVTVATGTGETVTMAVPVFASLVAVIVASPALTDVTNPVEFTVATDGLLLVHVTVLPESASPLASLKTADAWVVCPMNMLDTVSETDTVATGTTDTATVADPVLPSDVAVIAVVPMPVAVTKPLESMVATELLAEAQVIARPLRTLPPASSTAAEAVVVCPSVKVLATKVTATDATGAG